MPVALVLADFVDLLQAALPLILAVGWGILQLVSAVQRGEGKPKPAAPRRPRPAEGADAADKNDGLRSEVDEFLRRLKNPDAEAERPRGAEPPAQERPRPPQRQRPRRPRVEVLVDDDPSPAPAEQPRRLVERPDATKPPTSQPPPSKPAERGRRRSAPPAADQADHLRAQAAQAEARIHEKFDHGVGHLADQTLSDADSQAEHAYDEPSYDARPDSPGGGPKKPTAAEQIAAMLRDPDNVRNAVILNEILTRRS